MLKELTLYREFSGFIDAMPHIINKVCCFITAYRRDIVNLQRDIDKSGLSHIKLYYGSGKHIGAYCVINNRFQWGDFSTLMKHWQGKNGQECILFSYPKYNGRDAHGVLCKEDGSNENIDGRITLRDIERYYSLATKRNGFNVHSSVYVETDYKGYGSMSGFVVAGFMFWEIYQEELSLPPTKAK